jgi:hypothetical protein
MIEFKKRKIQKVKYTFMVSLPTDWIVNMKLGKGDVLKVALLEDQSLRLFPATQDNQSAEAGSQIP